jgi:hypothetical protein
MRTGGKKMFEERYITLKFEGLNCNGFILIFLNIRCTFEISKMQLIERSKKKKKNRIPFK